MATRKKAPDSAAREWKQAMRELTALNRKLANAVTALEAAQDAIVELTEKYPGGPGNILNTTDPRQR